MNDSLGSKNSDLNMAVYQSFDCISWVFETRVDEL